MKKKMKVIVIVEREIMYFRNVRIIVMIVKGRRSNKREK
jgi:hypothetical protein